MNLYILHHAASYHWCFYYIFVVFFLPLNMWSLALLAGWCFSRRGLLIGSDCFQGDGDFKEDWWVALSFVFFLIHLILSGNTGILFLMVFLFYSRHSGGESVSMQRSRLPAFLRSTARRHGGRAGWGMIRGGWKRWSCESRRKRVAEYGEQPFGLTPVI